MYSHMQSNIQASVENKVQTELNIEFKFSTVGHLKYSTIKVSECSKTAWGKNMVENTIS